jgi:plasmid stability protein
MLLLGGLKMPTNLTIENVPDFIVDRLRQRASLHRCSLQDELLAMIKTAARDERESAPPPGFAEEGQADFRVPAQVNPLEEVLQQLRTLPDERQQEVAQFLLAYLDDQDSDFGLSPEQIAEIERRMADDGPYATDEEVRELFARLTK